MLATWENKIMSIIFVYYFVETPLLKHFYASGFTQAVPSSCSTVYLCEFLDIRILYVSLSSNPPAQSFSPSPPPGWTYYSLHFYLLPLLLLLLWYRRPLFGILQLEVDQKCFNSSCGHAASRWLQPAEGGEIKEGEVDGWRETKEEGRLNWEGFCTHTHKKTREENK